MIIKIDFLKFLLIPLPRINPIAYNQTEVNHLWKMKRMLPLWITSQKFVYAEQYQDVKSRMPLEMEPILWSRSMKLLVQAPENAEVDAAD